MPSPGLPKVAARLDHALLTMARTRGHTPPREQAVRAFSRLGEHAACWLALGTAGLIREDSRRRRRLWRQALLSVTGAYAANYALKLTVQRQRPELPGLPPLTGTVSGLSFPSAHATSSFAAAWAYSRLLPAVPLYGVATAMAASRPYLGVHYPSDVLAGATLGTAIGVLTCR